MHIHQRAILINGTTLLCILLTLGCSQPAFESSHSAVLKSPASQTIYVVSHGWHTGLVLPNHVIANNIPALRERFGDLPFIELGWGDKGFYEAQEITAGLALRAMLWPTESVVHVVGVPTLPATYFPDSEVHAICLTNQQLTKLVQFIQLSFTYDQDAHPVLGSKGLYGDSQFYQGAGEYNLFNTCNSWTAKALASTGLPLDPTLKLTASSVMENIKALSGTHKACLPQTDI